MGTVDGPPLPLHTTGSFPTLLVERWRLVCAVYKRRGEPDNHSISTNDAWDLVAKMLFPDDPVRRITEHDVWLIDSYRLYSDSYSRDRNYLDHYRLSVDRLRAPKSSPPKELIVEVNRAYFRLSLMERVNQWFEDKGFDIVPRVFGTSEVDRILAALPARDARRARAGSRHLLSTSAIGSLASDYPSAASILS